MQIEIMDINATVSSLVVLAFPLSVLKRSIVPLKAHTSILSGSVSKVLVPRTLLPNTHHNLLYCTTYSSFTLAPYSSHQGCYKYFVIS